ncbi:glucose-6-phosphate dehydrogenase (coenzyme-F420) [Jatrophihabitans cynanchi]|jgi:coenzyme F420-dependent glucose-6-phosphate dehydrogenase|uniref:Glucose-6-phosphate dehydrogenase (Coenzyme-F420) n=1 Tax=Jatrophihabitans cynanchi TaxID=2944128 RepID=A0ABY7K648_9ACTN|nr:glucose-6-phosphate dehydrogenase (coenzyme-F420) [Jatrophihabitans sp. SB3-54]WAX58799.1 glucose-6-phosphate dehydrogenase (coenzyme-F420) [Jatrophihabitans sp. SB3-54]
MNAIRFGYKASNEQFAPRELLSYGVLAEECGFDSVFVSDHLQPWRHEGGHAPFAMTWLAALGARTERVTIGTSVLTPTFRYHPAIVAQAFATLGCLFPGRVVLGMGSGESMNEVPLGLVWPDGKERFARFREAVRLIRALWAGERVTFEGDFYRTDKATIYDRPDEPVPLWLAASGPAATRFAGRAGDGYITTSGKDPALYTDTLLPAVTEGAEKAGRQVADLEMMIEVKVSFDHDRDAAMAATHFWGALGLTPEQKQGVEDPVEMQRLADALSVEQTAKRFIVSTDPDEHVQKIKTYLDLGFNHLVFHAPGPDQAKFLKLYGEEILPRLRVL